MSLNFDLAGIKNYKVVCRSPDGSISPVTEGLIFMLMGLGIGSITAKNVDEVVFRLTFYQRLFNSAKSLGPVDIRQHIGLTTNVTTETRAHWVKRMVESFTRDVEHSLRD